jgi:hypothetical protein
MKQKQKHEPTLADADQPRQFSFDGFGVNGADQYKSRLATLTDAGHAAGVGPLLAAAPDLKKALESALETIKALTDDYDQRHTYRNGIKLLKQIATP